MLDQDSVVPVELTDDHDSVVPEAEIADQNSVTMLPGVPPNDTTPKGAVPKAEV
tara:strand:- start:332 stop:493 length:162 start_codon:yes stop_codon:yes gene_type:complete